MKLRISMAAGLLLVLAGCATYDHTGSGPGGYYRGSPEVRYRYPPGYYNGVYGYPLYGYPYPSPYSWGMYDYPIYRGGGYRRPHANPPRPRPDIGYRPPPNVRRPEPTARPPAAARPARPEGKTPSPWRNMGNLKRSGQ